MKKLKHIGLMLTALLMLPLVVGAAELQAQTIEQDILLAAAQALGDIDEIESLATLRIAGHGQIAYQDGGSNASGSPDAAQKWVNLNGVEQNIDLDNWRMELRQTQFHDFVFAFASSMTEGREEHYVVDGGLAYAVDENGDTRRLLDMEARELRIRMLANPIAIVRAAMEQESTLDFQRSTGGVRILDFESPWGDDLEVAFDTASSRPAWVRWIEPHENLGEMVKTAHFEAYQPWGDSGLMMPTSYNVVSDWRNIAQLKLYVDMTAFDVAVGDLSAPQSVRSTPALEDDMSASAEQVARRVWHITGNGGANAILFEFAEHLTLFEVPSSGEWTREVLETARATVPGKPVTEAIVSHHHFDHSGGVRQAVAEGLTIITHEGNIGIFEEMTQRPTSVFHDEQGRNPRPLNAVPVTDSLVLSDHAMSVEIYTPVGMNHMPHGVVAYVPHAGLFVQADMFDTGWDVMWWGNSYMDTIRYWDLDVERDVPVHGVVLPVEEVRSQIAQQVRNAQALCERVNADGMSLQGCPVQAIPRDMR